MHNHVAKRSLDIEKIHGYEIIEIWPKYSTSAPIEFIPRAHARWNMSTITRFILLETTMGHAQWQTSTLTHFIQAATTMGNAQWKTSTMTWFILLKTTMGHALLHTGTTTQFIWLGTIKGRLTPVNMTTATAQKFGRRRSAVN